MKNLDSKLWLAVSKQKTRGYPVKWDEHFNENCVKIFFQGSGFDTKNLGRFEMKN